MAAKKATTKAAGSKPAESQAQPLIPETEPAAPSGDDAVDTEPTKEPETEPEDDDERELQKLIAARSEAIAAHTAAVRVAEEAKAHAEELAEVAADAARAVKQFETPERQRSMYQAAVKRNRRDRVARQRAAAPLKLPPERMDIKNVTSKD